MGTLIGTPQARASFQQQLYPAGLDLNRSEIHRCLGTWRANSGASFRAGQPLMQNSVGEMILSDGTACVGLAKWNKITQKRTLVVDFPVTFGTAAAVKNLKPNILGAATTFSVSVRSAIQGGGTLYTDTADGAGGDDYTVNYVNGTITHIASGAGGDIDPALPVYVSYARSLTEDELSLEGKNFWQSLDEVTIQDLRIAVIEAPAQVFTTEFDPAVAYALTGATSNLYLGNSSNNNTGLLSSNSANSAKLVGHVISVPSAGDPWLGVEFIGTVVANT